MSVAATYEITGEPTHPRARYRGMPRMQTDRIATARSTARIATPAPLTILRAPHGFGKSLLAVHWLRSMSDVDVDVLWFGFEWSLRGVDADPVAAFWELLAERLEEFGPAGPRDGLPVRGRDQVVATLADCERPVFVVLDGYDQAPVDLHGLDHELIELVRNTDNLFLVVCARDITALEVVGSTMVDSTVLRPADLALSVEDIKAVAAQQSITLSHSEAVLLHDETGGWPALVQVILAGSAAGHAEGNTFALDMDAGRWFLRSVWGEFSAPDISSFVVQTGLVGEFTAESARTLCDGRDATAIIEALHSAGLLRSRTEDGTLVYRHLGAVQREVRDRLSSEDREEYEVLLRLAARVHQEQGKLAQALGLLARAQLWDSLTEMVAEEWSVLVERHADSLAPMLWVIPDEIVSSSPHLVAARAHLAQPERSSACASSVPAPAGTGLRSALGLADGGTAAPALGAAPSLDRYSGASPEVQAALPGVLYEWGVARLGANDYRAAHAYLVESYRVAVAVGVDAEHVRTSAVAAGIVCALVGDVLEAQDWLDVARGADEAQDDELRRRLLERVLQALVLVGRLEPHRAVAEVAELEGTDVPDDLWTLGLIVRAQAALCLGRQFEMLEEIDKNADRVTNGAPGDMLSALVASCRINLLLSLGQVFRARTSLPTFGAAAVTQAVAGARTALMSGDFAKANRLALDAEGPGVEVPRLRLETLLVKAAAELARGHAETALDAMREAVALSADCGLLLPFAMVPRSSLTALEPYLPQLRDVIAAVESACEDTEFPQPRVLAELSEREHEVLVALARSHSLHGVAKSLFLTTNTVKTHLRSIYRKLGAHSRDEAIRCAVECGLIEPTSVR